MDYDSVEAVAATVHTAAQSLPSLRNVPRRNLQRFCFDLSLVALAVRTGYLFDAFAMHHGPRMTAIFSDLIVSLRQLLATFAQVMVIEEPTSGQLFFVNTTLLREREHRFRDALGHPKQQANHNHDPWTSFVLLSRPPHLSPSLPPELYCLLSELCLTTDTDPVLPPFSTLPSAQPLRITELVPLAAFLLEYPVAYVPASVDQSDFLADTPLDVYECLLTRSPAKHSSSTPGFPEHVLLKFSCPSMIGGANLDLSAARLPDRLRTRFAPRLRRAGFSGTLLVRHSTAAFARVAL
ncbi:hypothetical protein B0H21DRAFT_321711 [Amylocystis lapponica]|nr:hypothetical protein B0H21DRAFT_321711 [Amylocystis lapponica]